jgi:serine/threonine protein kinase
MNYEINFYDPNLTTVIEEKKTLVINRFDPDPIPGFKFGDYVIEKILGEGTFGIVYLISEENAKNKYAALKVLKLWDIISDERKLIIIRFLMETHHAKIDSPYLVHLITRGLVNDCPFYIMSFCPNGDLRSKLNETWDDERLKKVAIEVLEGLKALHDKRVIHRDLKPENILFDNNNYAQLSDFGISGNLGLKVRITKAEPDGAQKIFGTYIYIPPEQFTSVKPMELVGPPIDIFAFGVLMYEVITGGKLPFGDPVKDFGGYYMRALKGQVISLQNVRKDISENWIEILHKCLQPDPKKRFSNVDEILLKLKT